MLSDRMMTTSKTEKSCAAVRWAETKGRTFNQNLDSENSTAADTRAKIPSWITIL